MFQTFVINLDRHAGRMRFMEAQLTALGVPFTRFRAVNGYDPAEIANAAVAFFADLSQGEIGAWESHRGVWREVLKRNAPGIVLEDDVVLASDFGALAFPDALLAEADIIKLDYFRRPSCYGAHPVPVGGKDRHAHRLIGSERLASAYLVTPEGARRLLDGSRGYFEPVDELIFYQHSRLRWNLRIWKVMPAVAGQMRHVMPAEELPQDIEDGIQFRIHKTGSDPKPGMTALQRNRMRLRSLLDWDFGMIRRRRSRRHLDAFRAREGVVTVHPEFFTPERTHIEQSLHRIS